MRKSRYLITKIALAAALMLCGLAAQAAPQLLHDNGPLVTNPGEGAGGADASALQTGMLNYGFGFQFGSGNRIADDFTITDPAGWRINELVFYGYQNGSGTTSTFTSLNLRIWNGPPGKSGSAVVFGDITTNRLTKGAWSNIYRVPDTALTDTERPVMALTATLGVTLPPGTYWLDWQADGTLASGPWAPPVTILGETVTGNAKQYLSDTGSWLDVTDEGTDTAQDFPFLLYGQPIDPVAIPTVSEWSQLALVFAMLVMVGWHRQRRHP